MRYVDADKLLEYLEKEAESGDVKYSFIGAGVQATINEIKKFPLEDVKPVVHARWEFGKCTKCGGDAPFWCMASTYRASSYCPDCGAKMDEKQ